MVKHSCATCLVALVVLSCLVATLIEAQGSWGYQASKPQTGQSTFIPKTQITKVPPIKKPPGGTKTGPRPPSPIHSCDVEEAQRIPCGYDDISAHDCDAIGCCFDRQHCYYGKAVTVQCTKDAQFIVVVARDATLPAIDLESISLLGEGQGCTHVDSNSGFAIYQFPVTSCGTLVKEESGVIIYENRMASSYEVGVGPRGAITRGSIFELLFQCRYIGNSVETLVFQTERIGTQPPVAGGGNLEVVLRLGNGQCVSKGCIEEDVAYSSYFTMADYPLTKVLRDPLYVDVSIVGRSDHIHLTLGHCWTTTTPNPHSLPQWDLLVNGCPYRDDRYLTTLVAVDERSSGVSVYPSHHKRFVFKMFTFVDQTSMRPLTEQVYIHCSTTVCIPDAGNDCRQPCYRTRRNVPAQENTDPKTVVSSPMIIYTSAPSGTQ